MRNLICSLISLKGLHKLILKINSSDSIIYIEAILSYLRGKYLSQPLNLVCSILFSKEI